MKLLVFVLNDIGKLEPVLQKLEHAGIHGATILSSKGMAMALENYFGGSFLGSLRAVLEPDREENRTVFLVIKDELLQTAVNAIEAAAGSFDEPNSGIMFTVPIDFMKGIK